MLDPLLLIVRHRMTWWDAFCLGYGLGLGIILAQGMVLATSAVLILLVVALSR